MKITKGLKIVHLCNVAPHRSGMFESVRDLILEERRLGYNSLITDVVPNNPLRLHTDKNDPIIKAGFVQGIEEDTWSAEADILCWHR